ncbi:helix-turn-helix domain-containing protein [Mycolicibacter icosiumassiliensis]|uniref:helix-turn-helix domain-containing protein n=1 Tax=Mycolicibacter icosiumassiliensis TaxID=1792835 RepID=UPI000831EAC7|nr:helix-turn-helix transcriptional regulator [Mycolicibacter icosiumassiliensis]
MDIGQDIKGFLMTRRARITPEQVGLPTGRRRRVPGLRREEVAQLAGVSIEYYTQIERGHVAGVSDEVLDAVAAALRLSEAERTHLFDLARAGAVKPGRRRAARQTAAALPGGVQELLDAMVGAPAVVLNGHLDVVAANALGRALYAPVFARATTPNLARSVFLDPSADAVFPDWAAAADDVVALLRAEAARVPDSPEVIALVGELATRSEPFRTRWAAHNVKAHHHGAKRFRHPVVGELTLTYNAFELPGAAGLSLIGYTAAPDSPAGQALKLLASWVATEQQGIVVE